MISQRRHSDSHPCIGMASRASRNGNFVKVLINHDCAKHCTVLQLPSFIAPVVCISSTALVQHSSSALKQHMLALNRIIKQRASCYRQCTTPPTSSKHALFKFVLLLFAAISFYPILEKRTRTQCQSGCGCVLCLAYSNHHTNYVLVFLILQRCKRAANQRRARIHFPLNTREATNP